MKYSGTQALFQQKIWERYSNNFIMTKESDSVKKATGTIANRNLQIGWSTGFSA